ncbi:MAG: 2-amino-4-hydroxy-6-hydroxymethyldihydropteridine diphosphokinase [Dehalococcoidia bacterium]
MDQPIEISLGIGTNIGEKLQNLRSCIELIDKDVGSIHKVSPVYQTEPWGNPCQDKFFNMVLSASTYLSPIALLTTIKNIEASLGRTPVHKLYQPRIIDIDILYYGSTSLHIKHPDLTIPHPLLIHREFVLIPLNDIQPLKSHPILKLPTQELLSMLGDHPKAEFIMDGTDLINMRNS